MVINVMLLTKALDRTGLRYEHRTWAVDKISEARDRAYHWEWIDNKTEELAEVKQILADSRWYAKEYGHLGFGVILQQNVRNFKLFQDRTWLLHEKGDNAQLPLAADASAQLREVLIQQGKRIYRVFSEVEVFKMLQSKVKILVALGRTDEAVKAIDSIIQTSPPDPLRKEIEKLKSELPVSSEELRP